MVTVTQQTLLGVLEQLWAMLENEDKLVKAVPFFFVIFVREMNKFVVFYQRSAVPFVMPWFSDVVWPSHPCLYYLPVLHLHISVQQQSAHTSLLFHNVSSMQVIA